VPGLEDLELAGLHLLHAPGLVRRQEFLVEIKFYYFDVGVFRSLRPLGPLDQPEMIGGAALEGLACQHLRAWINYSGDKHTLSYRRTRAGNEVDFVLYGKDGIQPIEVKNSKRIHPEDYSGLMAFREEYPMATRILLHQGSERFDHEGIHCIPCRKFLDDLVPKKPIMG
jgi:predicted AAA+ superfamily ATPase